MDEISNKTLATLLVVAIVISLAGTFFAMRGVSQVTNVISGAASTSPGVTLINISESVAVTLYNNTVDFGTGNRNSTVPVESECNLSTEDDGTVPDCWDNATEYNPIPFLLENTGNVFVNLTINSTTVDNFIDGTVTGGTRRYGWKATTVEPSCADATFMNESYTDFNDTEQLICSNFSSSDGEDEIYIEVNVSVPAGPSGEKNASVTFEFLKNY